MGTKSSIVFSVFVLMGIYIFRIYSHDQSAVTFAKDIENFKIGGVPEFTLKTYDTQNHKISDKLNLTDFHENVILVNFWATWCEPCTAELPVLIRLAQKHVEKEKMQIFAISVDKEFSSVQKFLTKYGKLPSNFHILLDAEGSVAHRYGTQKIPETYIISSKHLLLRKVLGDQSWASQEFENLIKGFMERKAL
jgi:thiol-disulfide isomerase/thioredoxin